MDNSDKLRPFKAYAYYFREGETLTFDPWDVSASASSKTSTTQALSSVDLTLMAGGLPRTMRLVSGPSARDVPLLPGPAGGLEMRVGGEGGYAWKRIEDLSAIDLPVRFEASQASKARLAFDRIGSSAALRLEGLAYRFGLGGRDRS